MILSGTNRMKKYPNKKIGNDEVSETPVTTEEQDFFFPKPTPITVRAKSLDEAVEKRDVLLKNKKINHE